MNKMKTVLSLLLALCLLCSVALAEPNGLVMEAHSEINEERALELILGLLGAGDLEIPAENKQQLDGNFGLINAIGEKLIVAKNGVEEDITLAGEPLLSVRAVAGEDFVLYTDLLPSYALVLKAEDMEKITAALTNVMAELGSFDLQAYRDIINGYIATLAPKTEQTVTVKEGILYTEKTTVVITEKGLAQVINTLAERFFVDVKNTVFAPLMPAVDPIPVDDMDDFITVAAYTNDQGGTRVELLDDDDEQQFSLVVNGSILSFTAGEDEDEGFDGFFCMTAEAGVYGAFNIRDRYDPLSMSFSVIPAENGGELAFNVIGEDNIGFNFSEKIALDGTGMNMLVTLHVNPIPYMLPEGFDVTEEIAVSYTGDNRIAEEMTVTTSPIGEVFPQGILLKLQAAVSEEAENLMSIVADIFFMDMEKELIHEEGVEYLFDGELELPDMTNVNMISVMDLLTGAVDTEALLQGVMNELMNVSLPALVQKVGTVMPDELNAVMSLLGAQ